MKHFTFSPGFRTYYIDKTDRTRRNCRDKKTDTAVLQFPSLSSGKCIKLRHFSRHIYEKRGNAKRQIQSMKKGKVDALHGTEEVQQLHSFVTSALYFGWRCYKLHAPAALPLDKEHLYPLGRRFCGPRAGLDALMKTEIPDTCRNRKIPPLLSQLPRHQTHNAIPAPRM